MTPLARYTHWLHTRWPAGTVERLPAVEPDGTTTVPGLRVVGDLTGIPLLKFAADTGAKAVAAICVEPGFTPGQPDARDLVIIGGGVSGVAAAIEARKAGLDFVLYEATRPFNTLKDFPKGKPIYTYPSEMTPAGDLVFRHEVKEPLVDDLDAQLAAAGITPVEARVEGVKREGGRLVVRLAGGEAVAAQRVIVAIGRSGNYRRLGAPGEDLDKVFNRLHDPKAFAKQAVLVVGGGDSALEAAIALAEAGAEVTLSYRKPAFARPKPDNVARLNALAGQGPGRVTQRLGTTVERITPEAVHLTGDSGPGALRNDVVFTLIGREAPLDFFRRAGVRIHGEWRLGSKIGLVAFMAFCVWVYHWKSYGWTADTLNPAKLWAGVVASADPKGLLYTLARSASGPSFYYTLAYSLAVGLFGLRRMRKRPTPYVRKQTWTLMFVQWIPLFILPEIILPWMGRNELFVDGAALRPLADWFFEPYDGGVGVERAYWRAYGFILAWPLMVYNWFTAEPMVGWLVLGFLQTFVAIPLAVRYWGKGAICGWLCSCGALAETLGDAHREKMPHGPKWNRLNMIGQAALAFALLLLGVRILGWAGVGWANAPFDTGLSAYKWSVDIFLGGILGVGLYFHYSGRVWCRFACPLAALMHIYARFTKFRIFADKKKCISCNVCTSVCHQGIDIMSFANQGLPMEDPECVRCSACVQSCPTGVLQFGRYGANDTIIYDRTPASLVQMAEALKA